MRACTILTLACAGMAAAGPLFKKAYVTEVETQVVVVTVTAGAETSTVVPAPVSTTSTTTPYTQPSYPVSQMPGVAPPQSSSSRSSPTSYVTSTSTSSPIRTLTSLTNKIPNTPASTTLQSVPSSASANPPSSKTQEPEPTTTSSSTTSYVPPPTSTTTTATASPSAVSAEGSNSGTGSSGTTPVSGTASGSATSGCDLTDPIDYASTAVYWHNLHRCNNSASALTWSSELAGWASTLAQTCNFHHDVTIGGGGYGQNIASYGTTDDPSTLDASSQVAGATSGKYRWLSHLIYC